MQIPSNYLNLLLKNLMFKQNTQLLNPNHSQQTTTENPSTQSNSSDQATFSPLILGLHTSADHTQPQPSILITQQITQQITPEQATNTLYDNGLLNQTKLNEAPHLVQYNSESSSNVKTISDEQQFRDLICKEFFSQARIFSISSNDFDLSSFDQATLPSIIKVAKEATMTNGIYSQKNTTQRIVDSCLDYCSHNPTNYQLVLKLLHLAFADAEKLFNNPIPKPCFDTYKAAVHQFTTWAKTVLATSAYL